MSTDRTELMDQIEQMDTAYREAITDLALTMVCADPLPRKPTTLAGLWNTFVRRHETVYLT